MNRRGASDISPGRAGRIQERASRAASSRRSSWLPCPQRVAPGVLGNCLLPQPNPTSVVACTPPLIQKQRCSTGARLLAVEDALHLQVNPILLPQVGGLHSGQGPQAEFRTLRSSITCCSLRATRVAGSSGSCSSCAQTTGHSLWVRSFWPRAQPSLTAAAQCTQQPLHNALGKLLQARPEPALVIPVAASQRRRTPTLQARIAARLRIPPGSPPRAAAPAGPGPRPQGPPGPRQWEASP